MQGREKSRHVTLLDLIQSEKNEKKIFFLLLLLHGKLKYFSWLFANGRYADD